MNLVIDGFFSHHEELSKARISDSRLSPMKRFVGNVENKVFDFFADRDSANRNSANPKHKIIDMLLGSLGYSASIDKIRVLSIKL